MVSFRPTVAGTCILLFVCMGAPAWADGFPDAPPVPAPPYPLASDGTPTPAPGGDLVPLDVPPQDLPPTDMAMDMAPAAVAPAPMPAPAAQPRLQRKTGSCCWPRDKCGWDLGPCGGRIGRLSIGVEGALVLFDNLEGSLGEPRANSLDWGQNEFDPDVGARATIGFAVAPRDRIEARGVWYGDLSAQSSQAGAFGWSPPAGSTTAVTAATLRNSAEMLSVEGNWWHEFCCKGKVRFSGVLGARYLRLEETAFAQMQSGAAAPITGTVNADVETDMIAGQIGAAMHWLAASRLEIGLSGKAILGSMRRRINVTDTNIFVGGTHSSRNEKSEFAFGGELEVSAGLRLTRNLSLTGAYTLLFVDGVVRANDAMDFSQANTGGVVAKQGKSDLLVHAFFLGITLDI